MKTFNEEFRDNPIAGIFWTVVGAIAIGPCVMAILANFAFFGWMGYMYVDFIVEGLAKDPVETITTVAIHAALITLFGVGLWKNRPEAY